MTCLAVVTEGWCSLCDEHEVLVDGLCSACYEDGDGPLPRWMAALLFEEASWIQPNAWREVLDYAAGRRGSHGPSGYEPLTWQTLAGALDEHRWARLVLEATAEVA